MPTTNESSPRLSTIPLAPDSPFFPRTLPPRPSSALHHQSLSTVKSPYAPPRPPRPEPGRGQFNPGWTGPFPSTQPPPPRSARPRNPSDAMFFDTSVSPKTQLPNPARRQHQRSQSDSSSTLSLASSEEVDLATMMLLPTAQPVRKRSASLKKLPLLRPPTPLTPPIPSTSTFAPQSHHHAHEEAPSQRTSFLEPPPTPLTPARLSINGFEALLKRGFGRTNEAMQEVVASKGGKEKGKARASSSEIRHWSDMAAEAGPSSPAVGFAENEGAKRVSGVEGTKREFDGASWNGGPREGDYRRLPLDSPEVGRLKGGARAAGGKENRRANWLDPAGETRTFVNTPTPLPRDGVPWRRMSVSREIPLEEVVVVPAMGPEQPTGSGDGQSVGYPGWFPRFIHFFYPLFVLIHIPATLFLDFNVLFMLAQIALSPALPGPSTTTTTTTRLLIRSIPIPTLTFSTAWWVAFGAYAACTLIWLLVVCLWLDFIVGYVKIWGKGAVSLSRVYRGAASFNYGCVRSYSHFSLLYRVRLAPFQSRSVYRAPGVTWVDGIVDSCAWYIQNWPTVLLLLPRAGLSLTLLLLFSSTTYGRQGATQARDVSYFGANGTLTAFASGVLIANSSNPSKKASTSTSSTPSKPAPAYSTSSAPPPPYHVATAESAQDGEDLDELLELYTADEVLLDERSRMMHVEMQMRLWVAEREVEAKKNAQEVDARMDVGLRSMGF
ncbi:hypothetical protein MNV49_000388 [Pseudohyphozyma bogoriensis]|nr:hypothetical protein MNV49_000388 [Pseudohyphozyma bogoriensis]